MSDFDLSLQFSVSLLPSVKLFSFAAVFDAVTFALEPERVENHPLSQVLVLCTHKLGVLLVSQLFVFVFIIELCWVDEELFHQVQVLSV